MGGDFAPEQIVLGALQAAPSVQGSILLVGDQAAIAQAAGRPLPANVEVVAASQAVGMDEKPTEALRHKRDSSIAVGVELVRSGGADGFVSAGNTGAATAASLLSWRTLPGIQRPAIATPMPSRGRPFVLLDAGASPDVEPSSMVEFAMMGRAYAQTVWGRPDPSVRLLNIGEEPGKGNQFSKAAYELLSPYPWFEGNVEGKQMFDGSCDVVVCDAFAGNVALKTAQGVGELVFAELKAGLSKGILQWLALPARGAVRAVRSRVDYAEYGGSPLLGLKGLCVICHGRSNARAIENALLVAFRAVEGGLVGKIEAATAPRMEAQA